MNPTSTTYFMVGGPFHSQEVTLPHQVATYNPVVDGVEERYSQAEVNLFGHRLSVLVHASQNSNDQRANESLAHALLNHPAIYQVWQNAPLSFTPPETPRVAPAPVDDTRIEKPLVDTPR